MTEETQVVQEAAAQEVVAVVETPKRKRGRPRKVVEVAAQAGEPSGATQGSEAQPLTITTTTENTTKTARKARKNKATKKQARKAKRTYKGAKRGRKATKELTFVQKAVRLFKKIKF